MIHAASTRKKGGVSYQNSSIGLSPFSPFSPFSLFSRFFGLRLTIVRSGAGLLQV